MRLFTHFLAAYLIALAVLPCCAWDHCAGEKPDAPVSQAVAIGPQQQPGHSAGDGDCGSCSPFFNCGGCGSVVLSESLSASSGSITGPVSNVYGAFIPQRLCAPYLEVWQPPSLSYGGRRPLR